MRYREAMGSRARLLVRIVLVAVVWLAWLTITTPLCSLERGRVHAPTAHRRQATDALTGIWQRFAPGATGDPVRFWYFHGDGKGLYRYGRVGLTNTHGFDYAIDGDRLQLSFRKTGQTHEVRFSIERGEDGDVLMLSPDPREAEPTRYVRRSDRPVRGAQAPALAPSGRLWIDLRNYATGGQGFAMYQLRPAGIDGRGTGWFHRGDFDDWSTQALSYRLVPEAGRLELAFFGEHGGEVTRYAIESDADARRLWLSADPRDFWHAHAYVDAGPSFGAADDPAIAWLTLLPSP